MKPLAWLSLLFSVALVGAQEVEGPSFDLVGATTEKVTWKAPSWQDDPVTRWGWTVDLKPRFTNGGVTVVADTSWTLPLSASLTAEAPTVSVAEAYVRLSPTESLDVTVGQKRFSLGVGQTFTVGDSYNPVIGFFDQKTGARGAALEWSPVSWASVSAGVSSDKTSPDAPVIAVGQVSLLWDQWQLTAAAVGRAHETFNPSVGVSYDLWGVILTAEAAAEFLPQGLRPDGDYASWKAPEAWSKPAVSASTGARWTPTWGDWDLVLSAEYLHWAQGWTDAETDAWKASVAPGKAAVRQALPLRSQENAFVRASLSTGGVFSISGFAAVDLQDRSVLGQGSVVWTVWDDLDLVATLQAVSGEAGTSWEFLNSQKDRYQASLSTTYHF